MKKKTSRLYVIRDDGQYDYKSGFQSYKEANDYRQERQRDWMNHVDYVKLIVRDETGHIIKEVNLTKASEEEERNRLLQEAGIPVE